MDFHSSLSILPRVTSSENNQHRHIEETRPAATAQANNDTASIMPIWWLPQPSATQLMTSSTFIITVVEILLLIICSSVTGGLVSPALNPTLGPTGCGLISFGANFAPFLVHKKEFWRVFSSIFLHSGIITLFVSMVLQLGLMLPLELMNGRKGQAIMSIVFIASGAIGNVFSCVSSPTAISTGALGGIMGVAGLRLTKDVLNYTELSMDERRRIGIVEAISALLVLIVGQSNFVDNYASFMGFVLGGFMGGIFYSDLLDANVTSQRLVIGMALLSSSFVVFVSLFLLGVGNFPLISQVVFTSICPSNTTYCGVSSSTEGILC